MVMNLTSQAMGLGCMTLCLGLACLSWITAGWAGNAKMMQQTGDQLIQINEQVVGQLKGVGKDAHVTVNARIKEDAAGHQVIYLDQARVIQPDDSGVLAPSGHYTSYVRHGALPTGEVFKPEGVPGGGHALEVTDRQAFQALWEAHPKAQVVELKGAAMESLESRIDAKPQRGFFVYW
ncbi:hypothetical protein CCP4SC76_2840007 [Gammaproteobacteria bacterium]